MIRRSKHLLNPVADNLFARNVPGMIEVLSRARVGLAGCGGLGSNAAVALARAGIGSMILADFDSVELSNLNRQYFLREHLGKPKTKALEQVIKSINPEITLKIFYGKITRDNVGEIFGEADILIEALDRAEEKVMLYSQWCSRYPAKPIIAGNGIAGYGQTEKLGVTRAGNIYFCGDLQSDMSEGLCAARVAIVANMQANVAIELLMRERGHDSDQ